MARLWHETDGREAAASVVVAGDTCENASLGAEHAVDLGA
jgi:hypothetical protein